MHDDPNDLRSATIQMVETALLESMATEHGMALQNLALRPKLSDWEDSLTSRGMNIAGFRPRGSALAR